MHITKTSHACVTTIKCFVKDIPGIAFLFANIDRDIASHCGYHLGKNNNEEMLLITRNQDNKYMHM